MMSPWRLAAATAIGSTFQTNRATTTTTTKPTGIARLAGQRSPTSRNPTTMMGDIAKKLP